MPARHPWSCAPLDPELSSIDHRRLRRNSRRRECLFQVRGDGCVQQLKQGLKLPVGCGACRSDRAQLTAVVKSTSLPEVPQPGRPSGWYPSATSAVHFCDGSGQMGCTSATARRRGACILRRLGGGSGGRTGKQGSWRDMATRLPAESQTSQSSSNWPPEMLRVACRTIAQPAAGRPRECRDPLDLLALVLLHKDPGSAGSAPRSPPTSVPIGLTTIPRSRTS